MIGFKNKSKKSKKNENEKNYSEKLLSCKSSFELLNELEKNYFETYSQFLNKQLSLSELGKKREYLKNSIIEDKKKFMSTEEMGDFSITEEIIELQKQYAEIQVSYKKEYEEYSIAKNGINSIVADKKMQKNTLKNIIKNNMNELKDVNIDIVTLTLDEDEQKKLSINEGITILEKVLNYMEKMKDFKIKNYELELEKLEILEPLNELLRQEEFVKEKLLELRISNNKLSDMEFLNDTLIWEEMIKLKAKYLGIEKEISNKKMELKRIKQEFSDNEIKVEFINEILGEIKKENPQNFKEITE